MIPFSSTRIELSGTLPSLGVKKEHLDNAFDEMQTKYGSTEKYLSKGLGLDAPPSRRGLPDLYLG